MIAQILPLRPLPTATADSLLPSGAQSHQPPQRWGRHRRVAVLGLVGALLSAGGSAWAEQFNFSTVALAGQPAPGTAVGVNYAVFNSAPTLNVAGQSAFRAGLTGTGVTSANDVGHWVGAPGG